MNWVRKTATSIKESETPQIDEKLETLRDQIKTRLEPRGDNPLDKGPQCWQPDCPSRGWPQTFDATKCGTCDRPFGRHKPTDLTKIGPKSKRCWIRDCPMRGKVRQCEHSI